MIKIWELIPIKLKDKFLYSIHTYTYFIQNEFKFA